MDDNYNAIYFMDDKMNIPVKVRVKATGELGVLVGQKEVLFDGFDVKLENGEVKHYKFNEIQEVK